MTLRERFIRFDDELARVGVPPLTAWWREGIGSWLDAYEGGRVLELFAAVGRGAAKSTALYKLATFFTLFGAFDVPPGERHYAVVLSRLKEEAGKGIAIISRWLTLLGIAHRPTGDTIELVDLPRGIRVAAASVAAASGWRAYFVGKDERSKWPMGGVEELEAEEVDTSAAAMTATHARAPVVSVGSAWGAFGAFYEAIRAGSDPSRVVLGPTPTWVAAPHITEESTRRRERDPRRWAREYACQFQGGASSAFDADDIAAIDQPIAGLYVQAGDAVLLIDSSAGGGDAWTWARAQYCAPVIDEHELWLWARAGERLEISADVLAELARSGLRVGASRVSRGDGMFAPVLDAAGQQVPNPEVDQAARLVVSSVCAVTGEFARRHTAEQIVEAMARTAHARPAARHVFGDPYQGYFMAGALAQHGLTFHPQVWTSETKAQAVATLRRWLRDRRIVVESGAEADALKKELLSFEEKILPSGVMGYGARRGGHDDRVALLLNAAMAENERLLGGSPYGMSRRRFTIYDNDAEANDDDNEAA